MTNRIGQRVGAILGFADRSASNQSPPHIELNPHLRPAPSAVHRSSCGILLVIAVLSQLFVTSIASAAIPRVLMQQKQKPDVEPLIQAMEAKVAAAGDGTWKVGTGWQNQPAVSYDCGFAGSQWYLKRTDGNADYVLFSDGTEFFEPLGRMRFALDTLERNQHLQYGLQFLLFNVNLRPRQFLGCKVLRNLGQTTADGATYTLLRVKIYHKTRIYTHAALNKPRLREIDYYYDATRQAIAKINVTFQNKNGYTSTVTSWDNFGTAGAWPKTISSQSTENPTGVIPSPTGDVMLTNVSAFTPQADPVVASTAKDVAAVSFYGGPTESINPPKFYQALVAANPQDLTDQVLLAESYFGDEKPKDGLDQWKLLEPKMTTAADKQFLQDLMVDQSGPSVNVFTAKNADQGSACVELIGRLVNLGLTDAQWREISRPLAEAWVVLHQNEDLATQLAAVDDAFIKGVVQKGSYEAVRRLMVYAEHDQTMGAKIDTQLTAQVSTPLPASGYANTQQALIIGVAADQRLWPRVRTYVAALQWDPSTQDAAKSGADLLDSIVQQEMPAKLDSTVVGQLVDGYHNAKSAGIASDSFTSQICRESAARIFAEYLREGKQVAATPAQLVAVTVAAPDSREYWDQVIVQLVGLSAPDSKTRDALLQAATDVATACQDQFAIPEYVGLTWLRIGNSPLLASRTIPPSQRIDAFNKSFSLASTDDLRFQALVAIVQTLEKLGEHDQALQSITGLKGKITTPEYQTATDALTAQVKADQQVFQKRAAAEQKQIDINRAAGQVAFLQDRLAEAKRLGKSANDLSSLQALIDQAQQNLDALKK